MLTNTVNKDMFFVLKHCVECNNITVFALCRYRNDCCVYESGVFIVMFFYFYFRL